MEEQGGGIADNAGIFTDFAEEPDYTLHGIIELRGEPAGVQGSGCFGNDMAQVVVDAGQGADRQVEANRKVTCQTVTLEVTVASTEEGSENGKEQDGQNVTQTVQQVEKMEEATNPPDDLIEMEELYCCQQCNKSFENRSLLTDHLQCHALDTKCALSIRHKDEGRSPAKRPRISCRKQVTSSEENGLSLAIANIGAWEKYPCPVCGEVFGQLQALQEHVVTHNGDQVEICNGGQPGQMGASCNAKAVPCAYRNCGLMFQSSADMEEHRREHYPFCCDQCDFACSSAKLLTQHKKRGRLKGKKFTCKLCPFESCVAHDLNKHYSGMHRDKTGYECNMCDFTSRYHKTLKKHLTVHSDKNTGVAEGNDDQEGSRQAANQGNSTTQSVSRKRKRSRCEEELLLETRSERDAGREAKSFRQRHFKVDVQEGMEHLYKTHICPECKRCFKKRTHLVEHLHLHFPDPSLQCPHCQKFFTSKGKLKVHLMRELGEKTHHCPLCDYSAVEKNSLNRHMASMHENTTNFYSDVYSCPACEEKFTVSNSLKEHMKTHKEERQPLDCFEGGCSFTADERKDFVRHLKEVHGAKAIECRYRTCGSLFGTEAGMEAHRRTHYAFHCDQCDFVCSNKHVFRRHKRRGHPGSEELACSFCPFKTFNPVEYNDHVGKMHANEKIHKCSECDFATAHKRVLNRHILLHTGEKPHKCELCDFTCRDVGYLSKHMLTHSDDKNYMCTECGYITKWKHYLTVHMRKHTGDLRYHCNQCSYRCHRADQLSSHKLRHQGKSLICEVCGFACKRKYELQKHMQVKHSKDYEMPLYQCQYCSYQTRYKQALLNHENCKHTKHKEFRCALCTYRTFSNTSLFFHKRKVHGYVPGDKEWLENYAKEEMAMNSSHSLLGYSDTNLPLSSSSQMEMAVATPRSEAWQKNSAVMEEQEKVYQEQDFVSPLFGQDASQPGEEMQSSTTPQEPTQLQQHLVYSAQAGQEAEPLTTHPGEAGSEINSVMETEFQKSLGGSGSQLEEVFEAQLEFHSAPSDEVAKQLSDSQLPILDSWGPCDTGTIYRDFGLNTGVDVQADDGNDEADIGEHIEDEGCNGGEHIIGNQEEVGHNVDVFADEDQSGSYELSDKSEEIGRSSQLEDNTSTSVKTDGTWISVMEAQLTHSSNENGDTAVYQDAEAVNQVSPELDGRSPDSQEQVQLCQSESEIKALRKQDKQQAQALVLEGRVQMLVVQTDAQVFKCERCSYVTKKEKAMVLHTKSGCQNKKLPLVCTACGATFKQQRGLNTHLQKKCPVIVKKHKLYVRQATMTESKLELSGAKEQSVESEVKRVRATAKNKPTHASVDRRKKQELSLVAVQPDQLLGKITDCGVSKEHVGADLSSISVAEQDQPEGELFAACEGVETGFFTEEALAGAPLVHNESLPSTQRGLIAEHTAINEHSQLELGAWKFRCEQGKFYCASCPFICSSESDIGSHVAGGCPQLLKLPCGFCGLLFRSERALRNHQAIKHTEEEELSDQSHSDELVKGSSSEDEGSGDSGEGDNSENSGGSELEGSPKQRRFFCSSCPFSCYQERALDTHRKKGCMKPGELQCSLCSFVCKSAVALKHHTRLHGKKCCRKRPRLSCQLCPFTCKQIRCLKQHVAIKHDGVKPYKCRYCDFSTTRRYRLDAHESLHTGVGRLACDSCQQTFGTGSKLRIHKLRVHEKRPTHFCALCDYSGYNQNDITRHVSSCHAGEPSAACGRCDARFSSEGALKQHCLRRHEEKVCHDCPSCVFACYSESTLRSHVQRQHPQLECSSCKERFERREQLEEHKKVHFSQHCPHCDFATRERQQLIQHLLDTHEEDKEEADGGEGGKPFHCPFCEFTCRHQMVFDYHMKAHGGTRMYKCTDCDYTTKNRQKITWHIRIHTGEKPYKCHLCNYACADPSRLKYHMRIHQEERKYLCPECGYKCKWINQLKYHMTKHTGAKPYQCDECDYCTNRADALRTHKETRHKETRSFICEQCGKGFKTRFLLKTHLKKHSEAKPYVCSVCCRGFRWQAGLRHHYLTHTNEHPFFCRHCSYKAKQKFQVVKHIQRHHPLKVSGDPAEGVGKVQVSHPPSSLGADNQPLLSLTTSS
ncbi:zinc finger protein 142 isoform X2 [Stegostoma tigrinum]|uniref:zinc finger protein 142 isoform X2 n=1 Tax=Stegostoma tigrinum TaxID=3053191 RepID=UPI00202B219B|nr:zinc finger protein 142 isoform X2 [Stegostoma tigrinum]